MPKFSSEGLGDDSDKIILIYQLGIDCFAGIGTNI